jgi:hypothetical protein
MIELQKAMTDPATIRDAVVQIRKDRRVSLLAYSLGLVLYLIGAVWAALWCLDTVNEADTLSLPADASPELVRVVTISHTYHTLAPMLLMAVCLGATCFCLVRLLPRRETSLLLAVAEHIAQNPQPANAVQPPDGSGAATPGEGEGRETE